MPQDPLVIQEHAVSGDGCGSGGDGCGSVGDGCGSVGRLAMFCCRYWVPGWTNRCKSLGVENQHQIN